MPIPEESAPWFYSSLACPDCQSALRRGGAMLTCTACGYSTPVTGHALDLRPHRPEPLQVALPRIFRPLDTLERVDLSRPTSSSSRLRGVRDSRELFAAMAQAQAGAGDFLDLGCGPRDQAEVAEGLGLRYVGLDISNQAADIKADAHALPFRAESFDIVFSFAVLEHLHDPFVAMAEVRRVLRPGGIFVGTVSQGEPFHDSYFHHTPWGLASLGSCSGLRLVRLWPSMDTLRSLGSMGHYSRPIRWSLRLLAHVDRGLPFLAPRRWLRWSRAQKLWDDCIRGGSLCFLFARD